MFSNRCKITCSAIEIYNKLRVTLSLSKGGFQSDFDKLSLT
jgi:hypothetical protein